VGAYALCVDEQERLLLARVAVRDSVSGSWTLPGGGLDWGERPEDGVLRELEEETGLTARRLGEVVGVYSGTRHRSAERPRDSVHVVGIVYRVGDLEGELRPEAEGSTDTCAWFTREEAIALPLTPLGEFAIPLAWPVPAPPGGIPGRIAAED
jgi:ADP-ribose pyrophosphatase YjhB (NUDIX family)